MSPTQREIITAACGTDSNGEPCSVVGMTLSLYNATTKQTVTKRNISIDTAEVVIEPLEFYVHVLLTFNKENDPNLKSAWAVLEDYKRCLEHVDLSEVPFLKLFVAPKKFDGNHLIRAISPLSVELVSRSPTELPSSISIEYEYEDTTAVGNTGISLKQAEHEAEAYVLQEEQVDEARKRKEEETARLIQERDERIKRNR